jgi:putative ABC transport system permease protein
MRSPSRIGLVVGVVLALGLLRVGALPVPVLALSLPFLVVLARKPVLRRLAVRNALRRPRETSLVLLGSMLGTAIITGSFIVGDTLDSSLRRSAFTQLGPVDELVMAEDPGQASAVEQAVSRLPAGLVDGVLALTTSDAAVATVGDRPRAEPEAAIFEVAFERARRFGGDEEATGISGATPGVGEAVVGRDLARTLDVEEGEEVDVHAYGTSVRLRVTRTLPRLGVAGLHLGFGSESPNLFVAPGTLQGLAAAAPVKASPPKHVVAVSNAGGVIEGAARTGQVKRAIEAALGERPSNVLESKQDLLKVAESSGEQFTQLFGGIGFFSVLAGVVLLVNIFVMLAQERKTELGMLRAVGLRRSGLVGSFSVEGWLYALGSAALGTVAGLGVGRVIVVVAAGIFGQGDFSLELRYDAELSSVQAGFTFGFFISLLTVVLTSLGIARLNVIRAIRDLPDPEGDRRRRVGAAVGGAVLVVLGGGLASAGVAGEAAVSVLVGPSLAAWGLVALLDPVVPRRPLVSLAAAGVLLWAIGAFEVVPDAFKDAEIPVFVVQGVISTGAAVALVSRNQDVVGAALRRLGGGARSTALRLGLAYPLARRFRTAMILTMYALVVFTLTFITTFSHLFSGQIDDFTRDVSGGFDLRLDSNATNPVPSDAVRATPGVAAVSEQAEVLAEFDARLTDGFEPWPAAAFDETFVERGPVALKERLPEYADDEAAYQAVLADPNLVIVSEFFLQDGGGGPPDRPLEPEEKLTMRDPVSGRTRTFTVVAQAESGFGNLLAYVSRPALESLFGASAVTNLLFVATEPGVDPIELADSLNGRFLAQGADAQAFREIVEENLGQQQQFFRLMQGYLALGLVVGIAGLGVVMVRAVRERRRQVGVLRSLGFPAASVRRAFILESGFVALEGIAIGTVLANVTAWRLVSNDTFGGDLAFTVPWLQLAVLVAGTFAASLLATLAPAQQASRIRPAVALRITD